MIKIYTYKMHIFVHFFVTKCERVATFLSYQNKLQQKVNSKSCRDNLKTHQNKGVIMEERMVIVADLQHLKAYKTKTEKLGRVSLELIEGNNNIMENHGKLSEKVSDRQGNFQGTGASGSGEDHNIELEQQRRTEKYLAQTISKMIEESSCVECHIAMPTKIRNTVTDMLTPAAKERITKNIASDITNIPTDKILSHFE